jgi:hypothetical protein
MGGSIEAGTPVTAVGRNDVHWHALVAAANGAAYLTTGRPDGQGGWNRLSTAGPTIDDGTPVAAVARRSDHLDFFVCGDDGLVHSTWWNARSDRWGAWFRVGDDRVTFGKDSPVAAVAPNANELAVFACDNDGVVWQAWWRDNRWDSRWSQVGHEGSNLSILAPNAPVAAITRGSDRLALFASDAEGRVCTISWSRRGGWVRRWARVGHEGFRMPVGAPVAAVSRVPDQIDLFVSGNDGRVYSTWGEGRRFRMPPGAPVAAVAPHADRIDLFVCGNDGYYYTTRWVSGGRWANWTGTVRAATIFSSGRLRNSSGFRSPPGTPLAAIARERGLTVLACDTQGRIFRLARTGDDDWGQRWRQLDPLLDIPLNLRLAMQEDRDLTLEWDRVPDADGYEIEFRGSRPSYTNHNGTRPVSTTRYVFEGYRARDYRFRVRATTRGGLRSGWSSQLRAQTPDDGEWSGWVSMQHLDGMYVGSLTRLSAQRWRVVAIQLLASAQDGYGLHLLPPASHRSACGTDAGVKIRPGETIEGDGLRAVYGDPEPEIGSGLGLLGCKLPTRIPWTDNAKNVVLRVTRRRPTEDPSAASD